MSETAAALSLRALLNCVLREFPERVALDRLSARIDLSAEGDGVEFLRVPFEHRSPTGHHLFAAPMHIVRRGIAELIEPLAAAELLIDRLGGTPGEGEGADDLRRRLRASCAFIARTLEARSGDLVRLAAMRLNFETSEQGLLAGHPVHPAPKAREGMNAADEALTSPEFAAAFPLHWFAVAPDVAFEGHASGGSAFAWIEDGLGDELDPLRARRPGPDFALLPVHPWQARHLAREDSAVAQLLRSGRIVDLGTAGGDWRPTSSVRTLYRADKSFMLKLSLSVGITNSVRVNLARELLRGADMVRFRSHPAWERLSADYPGLALIADPAFVGVATDGAVIDGLSVSIRENPFSGERAGADVTLLAALCEDLPGRGSRLSAIVRDLARSCDRSPESVALDWFERALSCLVRPVVALYLRHGIALEAHSQNLLIELRDGWPVTTHYRDNQGFFHHDRVHDDLTDLLPGLGEASGSVIAEDVVDERVAYYFLINAVFGLIGALGRSNLADENALLSRLAVELEAIEAVEGGRSAFVRRALGPTLQVKGNLKTRLRRMDELVGPPETQSVYVAWRNPLVAHVRTKAKAHG